MPKHVLTNKFPELQIHDVGELLGVDFCSNVTAANGTTIPFKGWIETKFQIKKDGSKEVTVPF